MIECNYIIHNYFNFMMDFLGILGIIDKNNLIKEFICKYDCIRTLKMSDKTLRKALDKNQMYYKSIGSKLQCI